MKTNDKIAFILGTQIGNEEKNNNKKQEEVLKTLYKLIKNDINS